MRTRENLIQIRVTAEERALIEEHAKRLEMQVAPYVRMSAMNPTIIVNEYANIAEHSKRMAEIRDSLNRIAFTIEVTNNYLPRQIETMVNLMYEVFQSENKLLEQIRESCHILR